MNSIIIIEKGNPRLIVDAPEKPREPQESNNGLTGEEIGVIGWNPETNDFQIKESSLSKYKEALQSCESFEILNPELLHPSVVKGTNGKYHTFKAKDFVEGEYRELKDGDSFPLPDTLTFDTAYQIYLKAGFDFSKQAYVKKWYNTEKEGYDRIVKLNKNICRKVVRLKLKVDDQPVSESQGDMFNDIGQFAQGDASFKFYGHVLDRLKGKYTITRKTK
jgi:hypothetical protein